MKTPDQFEPSKLTADPLAGVVLDVHHPLARHYRITSNGGADMGVFEGASPAEAIEALYRDAGYRDVHDCAERLGTPVEVLQSGLRVQTEVVIPFGWQPCIDLGDQERTVMAMLAEHFELTSQEMHVLSRDKWWTRQHPGIAPLNGSQFHTGEGTSIRMINAGLIRHRHGIRVNQASGRLVRRGVYRLTHNGRRWWGQHG